MWLPIFDFLGGKALQPTCISCIHGMNGDIIRITPTTATTISISVSPSRFLVAWGFLSKGVTVFVCVRDTDGNNSKKHKRNCTGSVAALFKGTFGSSSSEAAPAGRSRWAAHTPWRRT